MLANKNLNAVVTEIFIKGRKLNISLVFITQSFLMYQQKLTKLYPCSYYQNSKQRRTIQIAFNHSSNIDFTTNLSGIFKGSF